MQCFVESFNSVQRSLVGMERILRVPQRDWLEGSIIYNVQNAINTVTPLFIGNSALDWGSPVQLQNSALEWGSPVPGICSSGLAECPSQHEMHVALIEQANDQYAFQLLCNRMLRFFPGDEDCAKYVSHVTKFYHKICKTHSHTIVVAHMRVILNQWSTTHRYGNEGLCFFCSEHVDKLEHIVTM